jgi:DNA replication and repair protein RecF
MPLHSLQIKGFRSFDHASFDFHPHRNLVYGGNAAGKSTVLEAVQFLSVGKSSRSKNPEQLVRTGNVGFSIGCDCEFRGHQHRLSVQFSGGNKQTIIDGVMGRKSHETARIMPISLISPENHYDFQRESKQRRSALDWVLFHVEQDFQVVWIRYHRILQQRNAELKRTTNSKVVAAWNDELALHGDVIHEQRLEAVRKISPIFRNICANLLPGLGNCEIELKTGWNSAEGLGPCLIRDFDLDRRHGYTHSGPHRSDLLLTAAGVDEPSELSHGQRKLLFIAIKLSQAMFLYKSCSLECVMLVDDLSAELDLNSQERLAKQLADFPGQLILTSLDPAKWSEIWPEFWSFHVKHGQVLTAQNN